jgi:hypothetical protein
MTGQLSATAAGVDLLNSVRLVLLDEDARRLVSFAEAGA